MDLLNDTLYNTDKILFCLKKLKEALFAFTQCDCFTIAYVLEWTASFFFFENTPFFKR